MQVLAAGAAAAIVLAAAAALLRPGPGELRQVSAAFARMARTLKREDELRRGMAADIAHELRTPVIMSQGATEEMLLRPLASAVRFSAER